MAALRFHLADVKSTGPALQNSTRHEATLAQVFSFDGAHSSTHLVMVLKMKLDAVPPAQMRTPCSCSALIGTPKVTMTQWGM